MKEKNEDARREAAQILGNLGDTRAIEPLKKALKDENEDVRETAKIALEKIDLKKNKNSC